MAIVFREVSYEYSPDTPFAYPALKDVSLSFAEGKMTAVIGATGSGKSTLVQHLNALLWPSKGEVEVGGKILKAGEKPKKLKQLRKGVGLVFQFPEYQLFEETVLQDVMFGPKNFGAAEENAAVLAKEALELVGISPEYYPRSPLDLSGGQKRRVAIAGILAMRPEVLVLDEPTAGLDPKSSERMMELFRRYHEKYSSTVILVTHNMNQVIRYCDEVVVLKDGRIAAHTDAQDFFKDEAAMKDGQIDPPAMVRLQQILREKGMDLPDTKTSMKELADELAGMAGK